MTGDNASFGGAVSIASMFLLAFDIIGVLLLAGFVTWVGPVFADIYAEADVTLPMVSVFLVDVPTFPYLSLSAAVVIGLLVKEACFRRAPLRFGINVAVGVAVMLLYLAYVVALYLPLF